MRVNQPRSHRHRLHAQRIVDQRRQRADEHHRAGEHQQDVVVEQEGLARRAVEAGRRLQQRRAPGCTASSAPPIMITRNARMNMPRVGSAAKRMHRHQHAGAHQERAEQAQREREDGQQQRPALEQAALLGHGQRMDQRRAHQPGHEEAFSTGSQNQ